MKLYNLIVCLTFILVAGCHNDDDNTPADPISKLPPATQTGEGTFGCLLDGEAFLPGPGLNTSDCVYQFVDGGYYFALQANKRDKENNQILLGCSTEFLQLEQGYTYQLIEKSLGNAYGVFFYSIEHNFTSTINTGQLTITKLDFENHIVSGTFWYDVQDENGVVHQIREGRFDMHFTT